MYLGIAMQTQNADLTSKVAQYDQINLVNDVHSLYLML